MLVSSDDWENLMLAAGGDGTLLVGFKNDALRKYAGKTLAEVAAMRGTSLQDTAMDLVVEDGSRVQVVYFLISEDNVKRQIQLSWVSFGCKTHRSPRSLSAISTALNTGWREPWSTRRHHSNAEHRRRSRPDSDADAADHSSRKGSESRVDTRRATAHLHIGPRGCTKSVLAGGRRHRPGGAA
jgi:hypothetical protein